MITNRTVFILGAGASKPYRYYTGYELLQKIRDGTLYKHEPLCKELLNLGFKLEDITEFNQSLYYSGENSVDSFLEYRDNKDFWNIGKISMAYLLSNREASSTSKFYGLEHDNWYHHLYNSLKTNFDDFDKNNIGIITFNYDRSLEMYLFTRLKSLGKTEEECGLKLANMDIVHLYGKLDDLPWEDVDEEKKREYGLTSTGERLVETSKRIQIIPESKSVEHNESFKKAYSILENAKKIIFLGLDLLNEKNLDRLKINSFIRPRDPIIQTLPPKVSYFTAVGTSLGTRTAERSKIRGYFKKEIFLGKSSHQCTDFLRENVILK